VTNFSQYASHIMYVFGWFTRYVQLGECLWVSYQNNIDDSTNYLVVIFRYFMLKQRTA